MILQLKSNNTIFTKNNLIEKMKKLIMTLSLVLGIYSANAQGFFDRFGGQGTTSNMLRNGVIDKKDSNISGTQYFDEKFYYAEISGVPEKVLTRYNTATDEIEIKKEDGQAEFLLPKTEEYSTIISNYGRYILKRVNYTSLKGESINGYLVELWSNESAVSLLRRDKMRIEEAREGNGYTGQIPAKYSKATPEYYLQTKNKEVVLFPKNKKALTEMFPEKKAQIEEFLKANKVSWKNEEGMTKITQFIATL